MTTDRNKYNDTRREMKSIVFVTTNKGKIAYANDLLPQIEVVPYTYELIEPREDDIRKIAEIKVRQAFEKVQLPCIAMDIGFYIRALNGFPRAYVNHALETIGIEGLIKLMKDVEDRHCEFRECLAYYDGQEMQCFESIGPATIAHTIRGHEQVDKLSDLWYIVVPTGFEKTLAEFTEADFEQHRKHREKSSLSMFREWFENHHNEFNDSI